MASLPKAPAPSSHDRILNAARRLFGSRGYENTSTVVIARAAGTSESQLMKHFGSKEGLLEAIFEQGWEKIAQSFNALQRHQGGSAKLNALLDLIVTTLDGDPDLKGLMLLEGRRIRKEGRLVMMTRGYQEFLKVVDGILREMSGRKELRTDLNLEALRSVLIGMAEAMMRDHVL